MLLDKETLMNLYSINNIDYEIGILLNLKLLGTSQRALCSCNAILAY